MILKPRTETIIEINILNPEIKERIIPQIRALENVFLSKAIVKVQKNNTVLVTVLNDTNKNVIVKNTSLNLYPIPKILRNFRESENKILNFFSSVLKNSKNSNRETLFKDKLRLYHLNRVEKNSIIKRMFKI